jgi:hypothetical protein
MSLNLLDGKISTSNTMVDGEITRVVEHAPNTTNGVETIMDTASNAGSSTANPLPPDQVLGYHWLKVDVMVDHVNTSSTMHAAKTTGSVETTMDTAINADGATANPLPPDFVTPQKLNDISTNEKCPPIKYSSRENIIFILHDYSSICKTKLTLHNAIFDTPFLRSFQNWKMMRHYAYVNAKLNSLLQQTGNGTMPTIKWTPLKSNTPTVTANKVDGATPANAIAVSVKKKSEMKTKKTTKEIEDKDAADYKERLKLQRKITKI